MYVTAKAEATAENREYKRAWHDQMVASLYMKLAGVRGVARDEKL
jgi:hypothetical protein